MPRIDKIFLLSLPYRGASFQQSMSCTPMGISYLAAVLRGRYQVKILDALAEARDQERYIKANFIQIGLSTDEIAQQIITFAPQVVGISCIFSAQFPLVAELSAKIKKLDKEIIIVTGGTHPTFMPEESFRRAPDLDYILLGEAEESFPALLRALEKGSGIDAVDGLACMQNGTVKINPKTKWIEDLDTIPFPARDLLNIEKYFEINVPFMYYSKSPRNLSFISSRGCPFKCSFCSSCNFWDNRVRYRSVENVMAELRELKTKFGVEEIKFEEDNLLLNRERAKRLFRAMIDEKLNLHWNMPNGVYVMSLLDEELVSLMKESGCFEVVLAFESGDQDVLDNIIHKPLDLSKTGRVVKILQDNDIDTHAFFIIGFPGETKKQIKNTIRFSRKIKIDKAYYFIFNPLPGSALYPECVEKGYYDPELVYDTNYSYNGITTDEFNPAMLRPWIYNATILQNLNLLVRDPKKLFTKYLARVANRKNFDALTKAIRAAAWSMFKD